MTLPEPILAWWNARESREQKLLLIAAVFVVVAGLYSLVNPAISMYAAASREFQTADADHRWLKEQVRALSAIRSEAGGALPVNLPPEEVKKRVEADLQKKKIKGEVEIRELDGVKLVQARIEAGSGRDVMRWIEELSNGGYAVASFDLKNKGGRLSGRVSIGT